MGGPKGRGGGPKEWGPKHRKSVLPEGWGPEGWGPNPEKGWGPEGWGPEGWGPEGWGAQNFALFFPSPATIFLLSSLLGVLSWNLVVFEAPGP